MRTLRCLMTFILNPTCPIAIQVSPASETIAKPSPLMLKGELKGVQTVIRASGIGLPRPS